jgi:hypothetical protein
VKIYSENGQIRVPTAYDISGSANFANKGGLIFTVHRHGEEGRAIRAQHGVEPEVVTEAMRASAMRLRRATVDDDHD